MLQKIINDSSISFPESVIFLAGGEGTFGIGDTATAVGLDGASVGCAAISDLPSDRKGAVGAADEAGVVYMCGGLTVRKEIQSMSI